MGERDSTDDVLLPDELKSMIDQFAIDAAKFFHLRHHIDITHEQQITVAIQRTMRLLLSGEDANSIRWMTGSPWPS